VINFDVIAGAFTMPASYCGFRESTDGKKIPYRLDEPAVQAKVNDETGWGTLHEARRVYEAAGFDGIGVKLSGDGLACIDLDKCRDAQTGAITSEAQRIVDELNSFTEISFSGAGLHVFVRAWLGKNHSRAGLECYGSRRYIALTGHRLPGTPAAIEERSDAIAALITREFGHVERVEPADVQIAARATASADNELIEGARNNTLASFAGRLRRDGLNAAEMLPALLSINTARCRPPLDDREVADIANSIARYTPAEDTAERSETGDAEFFASAFGDQVRFDHRRGRFLIFTNHRWTPDPDGALHRLAIDCIRLRRDAALRVDDLKERKKRVVWALQGESRRRLDAMLNLARAMKPISDKGEQWDCAPDLLGVANGVVDLSQGILRDGRADDRMTMAANVAYDAHARCPLWEKTIAEIFDHDAELIAYIQRAIGYSLTGDTREECLFLCWGDGRNGKGTILNTLGWLLGDYADNLSFSALELHDRSSGSASGDIAKLVRKRFVTASESGESARFNESRLKTLTGRDPISARFLYQEEFTFTPVAKFWLSTNCRPRVRDMSEGFWSRVRLIPFTQTFAGREDRQLKDKLREEGAGILNWAIEGCRRWQRDGLNPPAIVRDATNDYRQENRPLTPFIDARCLLQPHARAEMGKLYAQYTGWCDEVHIRYGQRLTLKAFSKELRATFDVIEGRHASVVGIGVRSSDVEPAQGQVF
jgi:putative DNA primase/helicase